MPHPPWRDVGWGGHAPKKKGAATAFFGKLQNAKLLAISLGLAGGTCNRLSFVVTKKISKCFRLVGVMIYVSFMEILATKARFSFSQSVRCVDRSALYF